jgi:hypothetical protein
MSTEENATAIIAIVKMEEKHYYCICAFLLAVGFRENWAKVKICQYSYNPAIAGD